MRKVIGFDVDGVIARTPFRSERLLLKFRESIWNELLNTQFGKFLYQKIRFVDKEVQKVLYQLRAGNHCIVIATYFFEERRREVEKWLSKNQVFFDKLVLPKNGESPSEFKGRIIREEKCQFFVEDKLAIIKELRRLPLPGVTVIRYRGRGDLKILRCIL